MFTYFFLLEIAVPLNTQYSPNDDVPTHVETEKPRSSKTCCIEYGEIIPGTQAHLKYPLGGFQNPEHEMFYKQGYCVIRGDGAASWRLDNETIANWVHDHPEKVFIGDCWNGDSIGMTEKRFMVHLPVQGIQVPPPDLREYIARVCQLALEQPWTKRFSKSNFPTTIDLSILGSALGAPAQLWHADGEFEEHEVIDFEQMPIGLFAAVQSDTAFDLAAVGPIPVSIGDVLMIRLDLIHRGRPYPPSMTGDEEAFPAVHVRLQGIIETEDLRFRHVKDDTLYNTYLGEDEQHYWNEHHNAIVLSQVEAEQQSQVAATGAGVAAAAAAAHVHPSPSLRPVPQIDIDDDDDEPVVQRRTIPTDCPDLETIVNLAESMDNLILGDFRDRLLSRLGITDTSMWLQILTAPFSASDIKVSDVFGVLSVFGDCLVSFHSPPFSEDSKSREVLLSPGDYYQLQTSGPLWIRCAEIEDDDATSVVLLVKCKAPVDVRVLGKSTNVHGETYYDILIGGVPQLVREGEGVAANEIAQFERVSLFSKQTVKHMVLSGVPLSSIQPLHDLVSRWDQQSAHRKSRSATKLIDLNFKCLPRDGNISISMSRNSPCTIEYPDLPRCPAEAEHFFYFQHLRSTCCKVVNETNVDNLQLHFVTFERMRANHSFMFSIPFGCDSRSVCLRTVIKGTGMLRTTSGLVTALFPGATFTHRDGLREDNYTITSDDCEMILINFQVFHSSESKVSSSPLSSTKHTAPVEGSTATTTSTPQSRHPRATEVSPTEAAVTSSRAGKRKQSEISAEVPPAVTRSKRAVEPSAAEPTKAFEKNKPKRKVQQDVVTQQQATPAKKAKKNDQDSKTYCRDGNFFTVPLEDLVYPVYSVEEFEGKGQILCKQHLPQPAVKAPNFYLFSRKSGISQPWSPVWQGDLCFAPILVSAMDKSTPSWRLVLGFGQKYDLGPSPIDQYCAGFIYSSKSTRVKRSMLTFLSVDPTKNGKKTPPLSAKVLQSIKNDPFRLIPINDIMGAHVPMPIGDINELPEDSATRIEFFRHVTQLFSAGGTLPYLYNIEAKEVMWSLKTLQE
jgi:hypothetical protein